MKWCLALQVAVLGAVWPNCTEKDAAKFLEKTDKKFKALYAKETSASWEYGINQSDDNRESLEKALKDIDDFQKEVYEQVQDTPWQTYKDPLIRRQFKLLGKLDKATIPEDDEKRLEEVIVDNCNNNYNTLLMEYKSENRTPSLYQEEVLERVLISEDVCETSYYWDGWQTEVGRQAKTLFEDFVKLENEVAVLNHYTDAAAQWRDPYEIENIEEVLEKLMEDIMPLYRQLHAYVRRQLWKTNGEDVIDLEGPIPANMFGNLVGFDAVDILNKTSPYPTKDSINITPALETQNYTGLKMAKAAEQFFVSLGFEPMTEKFWKNSIFEQPADGEEIDCSYNSYNFYDGEDYRIKLCATPTEGDWRYMHQEVIKIASYMQRKNLPWIFQDNPSSEFSTMTGNMMHIFSTGPTYLKNMGLLDSSFELGEEQIINALFYEASLIIFFMPYAYSLDLWRWKVFQGEITSDKYNCEYWKLRLASQGVEPPVDRDEDDFDPGSRLLLISSTNYMSSFVSPILHYQLLKGLCEAAGQYDPNDSTSKPLMLCDIYNSKAAGDKLKSLLALGKSHHWPDAVEKVTGTRTLDAGPLLAYFQPLYEWLKAENSKTNEKIGWTSKHKRCYGKGETKPADGKCRYS